MRAIVTQIINGHGFQNIPYNHQCFCYFIQLYKITILNFHPFVTRLSYIKKTLANSMMGSIRI